MAKSRWELEAERKKKAQQQALAAVQQAIKSGTAYKDNAVTDTVKKAAAASTAKKTSTTPKASTVTVSKPQGANIPTFLQGSGRTTAEKVSTPKQQNGFSSLQTLAEMPTTVQSIGNSVLQTSNDMRNLQRNSLLWHGTTDANERARLKSENDAIRKRLGLSYDNGNTYNPRTGQNLSQMTDMLYGSSAATRANTATQYAANQLPQILSQQASVRSQEDEEKGIAERVMETIEASTKRVRAGLDNWFATGNIAVDEEAEQKFLAGEELGWLDQLRMKERWGENWESYLSGVRDAYQTGNTAIIEDYEQRARALNNLYDTTSLFDEAAQQAEAAKAGLSTAGKTALDAIGMGADMLGAASIASTGGGGAGLFTGASSVSAAGQAADQARRMGANAAQQEDYGNAVGALNFAVERLGGIGGGQAAAKIANRMLPEAVKNAAGKVTSTAVGRVLAGGAEEGLEGALQSEGERALRNVILDANERFDPAKFGVDIGYNALMGSLFRGGQEVAGTVLGGMRQGQTGNAAAQQAQQTNDTTTVSSSGFLLPEAKRQRMAAQDAAYAAQIDDVFRGNMPTDRAVSIGDTPDILLSIGATDLPMTMKQSTARKIAFPAGYMGGAHNLGVPALKRLPEQLRDPAAVLRSKTQPDSFVVLTEWNDTNGNPVIIALHLDKQGVVDVTNEVASAYGKNNFAALTGENGENVLYTKNNKSIDQILDDRLQLPALLSDDTLVAYSIAQQAGKSNAEQETQALGRRLAELDAQKRQAEGLLPGPIRDRAIAEAEQAMQEVQQQATQTGAQQTTSDPGAQVPASEAMQYGKPPELAMLEARERARIDADKTINIEDAIKQWDSGKTVANDTSAFGKLRNAVRYAHRNIVSGQAEIERFAKQQQKINPKAANANDLAQISRTAGSTVDTIAEKALVNRKGDVIGDSWQNILKGLTEDQLKELNFYRLHKHNVDRMSLWERTASQRIKAAADKEILENYFPFLTNTSSAALEDMARNNESKEIREVAREYLDAIKDLDYWQKIENKPVIGRVSDNGNENIPYTADESVNIVREMDSKNPKLKEWAQKAETFHDTFMHEWAVGSGLMSEEQFQMLKERYPNYVQTYRVKDNWGGDADVKRRGNVNTGSPIKEAVGDITEIIPFEDAEMMQVNSLVKTARQNELFQNIYAFAKENPEEAAPYVRVTGEDVDYQAPESIDDLTGMIADAAMSEQGGIYTIRAMIDGKPVVMQVNADFYAGLQNLFGQDKGSSDSFMKKTFGTATNVFKQLTTGRNPLFFLTNLPKDFQTAYINTTSDRKLLLTYLADVAGTIRSMAKDSAEWNSFQALGGTRSGFYHNEKGFTQSAKDAGKHKTLKKLWSGVDAISENTEALWRFNEYRTAIKKYGDTLEGRAKAIQAAADITTNFSRSAPATKAAENYCAYLNASVQGLDKMARQLKSHPFITTRRAAEIIALPTLLLYLVNRDDEDYQDLNNRTKDNYFCVPLGDSGKFLKIPKSREYGVAMGALLERFFRLAEGEEAESAFRGIADQFFTNLAPSNPVTDNILKTVFIDLPTNRDFAGRSIVPERMSGLSPENQYDYSTSGAGRTLANIWNATVGRGIGKVSPIQMDYLIDSNLGFIGDAIIGATTQPKSPQQMIEEIRKNPVGAFFAPILNTLEQKFVADPMYQSGVTDAFYEELDAAEKAKNDKNLTENIAADVITPEEKYYSELSKASGEISELRKQERELLADRSLTDEQREAQVREIRRQINEIAKAAPDNAQRVRDEYAKTYIPEISYLEGDRHEQALEAISHGVTPQQFAETDKRLKELTNEKGEDDKKVRTAAEAREMVLDEVLQNSTLSDSEKEAIADYVIISSIGEEDEKTRQNWENIAKGKVNASDFVRFQADASIYDDWAEGTGTDNAANVAKILRGYEGLTDEQRDVLFQTYRDNMSVNPFHVSVYEKAIDPNGSFFSALTDDGKARLRSLLNEYEQDINEGAELDEWRAKAYMAEKEAGIAPGIYAMYRVALETANTDGKGNPRQSEAEACVNAMDGLTQYQKAYLYASTNSSWKNNPFGNATVGEYSSGLEIGINPIEGGTVTSGFGPRDSFQTDNGAMSSSNHPSIDIGAPEGTPIGAYKSGKVTKNGWVDGYGWTIEVTHSDGTVSAYHHMMEQSPVSVGTEVTQGDQIGKVGQTGNSKGAHLDLTITRDGKPIDPASLIPELKDSATGYVWTGSNVYTNVTSGSGKSSSGSGSGKNSSLKNLNDLLNLDSLF